MIIAHILPFAAVGGTEHGTLRLIRAVGARHIAFCPSGAAAVREFFERAGVETASYEMVEPSYRRPRPFLRACLDLKRELRARRVDIVHCADLLAAHHTAIAGRMAGLPVVCHIRSHRPDVPLRDRSFLLPVNRFVFVSEATRRAFFRGGPVVYDGIDLPDPVPPRGPGPPVVTMIARLTPEKDYPALARAAARVLEACPATRFVAVGDYQSTQTMRECHAALVRQTSAFEFTGFQTDVGRYIAESSVIVHSTLSEGLPLAILEAMSYAKPVVATAVGGIPEMIRDGETGFLVPPGDDAALADRILRLLGSPDLAAQLGAAARELCRTRFSTAQFARAMADVYAAIARPAPV
ncbi:MAG: glycosyltransferase family 4 protein [Acidobacteriota bacterium]